MDEFETKWSDQELMGYILLTAAEADHWLKPEEVEIITSVISGVKFENIRVEFEQDNDYTGVQKIQSTVKRLNYNLEQIDHILGEMKKLFESDGDFDQLEKNLYRGLERLLKK